MLLAVVAGGVWGLGVFDRMSQGGYETPGSEAARVAEIAGSVLDAQSGDLTVIYSVPSGRTIDDPEIAARIERTLTDLPDGPVEGVNSYWHTQNPQLANPEHTSGLALIDLAGADINAENEAYRQLQGRFGVAGAETDVAGQVPLQVSISQHSTRDLAVAEAISMPIVLVLLVIIFGGVVAASLPVLVGGMAVFGSLGLLHLISLLAEVNVFAVNVASLLGLGLAIDYGLFLVGRFREELATGTGTGEAVGRSVATAGRTVAFSATLLVIALGGLLIFPQSFLRSLAFGGMSAVALAAVISLTVLPAVMSMLGHRIDKLAVPWRRKSGAAADEQRRKERGWRRFADAVMKRPLLTALPIVVVLGALATPFVTSARFGTPDERILPENDPARQAIERLAREFPAMAGTDIRVVLRGEGRTPPDRQVVQRFLDRIADVPAVGGVRPAGSEGDVVVLQASTTADPYSSPSNRAVEDIRELPPPQGVDVLVGGPTALNLDSLQATVDKLPWVAALLVGATLVLMFLAFGSVLLPIKAVIMSVLSLSATFGALTWIFVQGHGAELLGVTPAPMEVGIAVLMASVVFGLSTDYEVFLLSRMVEARAHGSSTKEAVRTGLAKTGRVITAAALLLIVVTGAFAFSSVTVMRLIGVGMIIALALDATVVRMILVPALLALMGNASWWAPGPLKRLQKRVGAGEAEAGQPAASVSATDEPSHKPGG
ncbi:MMPL family transporter [Halopolyspora algeriensis]|nr:MMPL family transporter [Halopolyspora algeriensis]